MERPGIQVGVNLPSAGVATGLALKKDQLLLLDRRHLIGHHLPYRYAQNSASVEFSAGNLGKNPMFETEIEKKTSG